VGAETAAGGNELIMVEGTGETSPAPRDVILEASARVVSRRGLSEARLIDIAEEAGVSIGLLQHNFRTRDRLLTETFETHSARLVDDITRFADREQDPSMRLRMLLRFVCAKGVLKSLEQEWALWLEYWLASTRDPALARQSSSIYKEWQKVFRKTLASGVTEGVFHPVRPVADIVDDLLAMLDGLMIRVLLRHANMTPARVEKLLVEFSEDSLKVRLPAARSQKGAR
jgi:AcrR family transcriptional regulator